MLKSPLPLGEGWVRGLGATNHSNKFSEPALAGDRIWSAPAERSDDGALDLPPTIHQQPQIATERSPAR